MLYTFNNFNNIDKKYQKGNIIESKENIKLTYEGTYYNNPPEDILFKDGWEEVFFDGNRRISNNPNIHKKQIIKKISIFDKSKDVNSFFVGNVQAWIDRDTRVSLMNSTQILKNSGQENTILWLNGQPITISCDSLIQMLTVLEIYALQCYNVTEQHKANVNNLETIEEIKNYDFKVGYPEKLVFNV